MSERNPAVVTFKSNADSETDSSVPEEEDDDEQVADLDSPNSLKFSQLNLKSSVLCPKTSRLTSQYLAWEQLDAHHKMVNRAKACVDTAPPKSLKSCIGQMNKRYQQQSQLSTSQSRDNSQSGSLLSSRVSSPNIRQTNPSQDIQKKTKLKQSGKMSRKHIPPSPSQGSSVADKISWYLEAIDNGVFPSDNSLDGKPHHGSSLQTSFSHYSPASSVGSRRVVKGDLMDQHKSRFTNGNKLFVPRLLLNNSAKSKLRDMRCYNPPRRLKGHVSLLSSELCLTQDGETTAREDLGSSSHKKWLTDQAQRAQARKQVKSQVFDPYSLRHVPSQDSAFHETGTGRRTADSPLEILSREEETKYLNFISEVTEDILSKGVFTDRAIKRAFHFHMQMRYRDVDQEKMQQLLDQLLEDLCITNDDSIDFEIPSSPLETTTVTNSSPKAEEQRCVPSENSRDYAAFLAPADNAHLQVPDEAGDSKKNPEDMSDAIPEDPTALS